MRIIKKMKILEILMFFFLIITMDQKLNLNQMIQNFVYLKLIKKINILENQILKK